MENKYSIDVEKSRRTDKLYNIKKNTVGKIKEESKNRWKNSSYDRYSKEITKNGPIYKWKTGWCNKNSKI